MSSKIFNGYISPLSLNELLPFFKEKRKGCIAYLQDKMVQQAVQQFVFCIDGIADEKLIPFITPSLLQKETFDKDDFSRFCKCLQNYVFFYRSAYEKDCLGIVFDIELSLFPVTDNKSGKTLVQVFIDNDESIKTFWEHIGHDNYLRNYQFFDNIDDPEFIPDEEWIERARAWDLIEHPQMDCYSLYCYFTDYYVINPTDKKLSLLIPDVQTRAEQILKIQFNKACVIPKEIAFDYDKKRLYLKEAYERYIYSQEYQDELRNLKSKLRKIHL